MPGCESVSVGTGDGVGVDVTMRVGVGIGGRRDVDVGLRISGVGMWACCFAASVAGARVNAKVRNPIRPQKSAINCLVHILKDTKILLKYYNTLKEDKDMVTDAEFLSCLYVEKSINEETKKVNWFCADARLHTVQYYQRQRHSEN